MFKKIIGFCLLSSSLAISAIQAKPLYEPDLVSFGNRWTITAYDDSSATHRQWATQGLCFYLTGVRGTHEQYIWVSDTFPNWNGRAVKEGDNVYMHGDYANDIGHDGMEWELTTASKADQGFGHWHEWREDARYGRTIGFANAKLTRVGQCRWSNFQQALEEAGEMEEQFNKQGERIVTPSGFTERELKSLDEQ